MLLIRSVRFSVPPKPSLPTFATEREVALAEVEILRCALGSSYAPGSPVWFRIAVEGCGF
jgi:hypothetical protein